MRSGSSVELFGEVLQAILDRNWYAAWQAIAPVLIFLLVLAAFCLFLPTSISRARKRKRQPPPL
jgi:Na+/serine symporter